jgi:hypothetical protein
MAASQNNLSLVINQQDTNGVNILNRLVGAIPYAGVAGEFNNSILTTTGATSITVPTTNILQFYFRNTSTSANITVSWTPLAATGSVIASKIGPSGAIAMWCASSGSSQGFSALSLTADVANATFEYFLGG